jgi:prefoldin subunit 5
LGNTRGKSGQGAAFRRIKSRFQELEHAENSLEEIMKKLSEEFPELPESEIRSILKS